MRNEIILDNNAKGSESMVFNTGAALLDAIVLAVVSREDEGTYGCKKSDRCIRIYIISGASEAAERGLSGSL